MPLAGQVFIVAVVMLTLFILSVHMVVNSSKGSSGRYINTIVAILALVSFFAMCSLHVRHTLR